MSHNGHREVEHQIPVGVPADAVYRLIADVENWPSVFPPTIHVETVERSADSERIRIWATANGEVKTWTSRRVLDPARQRIDFRQEVTQPPVASMGGAWVIDPVSAAGSRVRLLHDYRAIDDDPERLAWIDRAVDTNSTSELAALKATVEAVADERLTFSFEDSVVIDGAAGDVYDFLNEAQHWKDRLPHVDRVVLTEEQPGLQVLEMDTRTANGSAHTTKSVRVCFPGDRIVYKQTTLPALMTLHTGVWKLAEDPSAGTVTATSRHTVSINEPSIAAVLGDGAGLPEAREFVRNALGGNSQATLRHARQYAESRRSGN